MEDKIIIEERIRTAEQRLYDMERSGVVPSSAKYNSALSEFMKLKYEKGHFMRIDFIPKKTRPEYKMHVGMHADAFLFSQKSTRRTSAEVPTVKLVKKKCKTLD